MKRGLLLGVEGLNRTGTPQISRDIFGVSSRASHDVAESWRLDILGLPSNIPWRVGVPWQSIEARSGNSDLYSGCTELPLEAWLGRVRC